MYPGAGNFERRRSRRDVPSRRHNLLRDHLGRLAQLARQLEGDGRGQFAELQIGRSLQRNVLEFEVVLGFEHALEMRLEPVFQFQIHVGRASEILDFQGRF